MQAKQHIPPHLFPRRKKTANSMLKNMCSSTMMVTIQVTSTLQAMKK